MTLFYRFYTSYCDRIPVCWHRLFMAVSCLKKKSEFYTVSILKMLFFQSINGIMRYGDMLKIEFSIFFK